MDRYTRMKELIFGAYYNSNSYITTFEFTIVSCRSINTLGK